MPKPLQVYDTPEITVTFDPNVCIHSGVCLLGLPLVFDLKRKQWIRPELAAAVDVAAQVARCPSGALQYRLKETEGAANSMTDVDTSRDQKIVVTQDGPYLVSGSVPLAIQIITPNEEGLSWDWTEGASFPAQATYKLCRCGRSKSKPFCDGTHSKIGFDGTETASRVPIARQSETIDGPTMTLSDAGELCAFARFCDVGGKIWSLIETSDDPETRKLVIRETMHCPAGRLVLHDKRTHKAIEDSLPPSIGLVEDPALGCSGPLWVRGGITIESADGMRYETRNRVTLCRCGASVNKPFCNGSHASIKFHDGLAE